MRSHYCGALGTANIDESVTLCGWVDRRRDHGGVIFLDLRDREGIVQVVFDPDTGEHFERADRVRGEYVLRITGRVRARSSETINPAMATGDIEVLGQQLEILNSSATPPFQLDEFTQVGEDVRLQYRYMDLRRHEMQERLMLRSRITSRVRGFLDSEGFLDIETPILTRATPEGARDYLVPSRTHPGQFFALPQSPQLFKQLLMVSGFDRYYQIAKCFRDEDLRADRQPEFTQIDIETAFLDEEDIMEISERMIRELFRAVLEVELPAFPRMSYAEDKPDLRVPMELVSIDDLMSQVEFKVFRGPAQDPAGRVAALKVPGGATLSRKEIDAYTDYVSIFGARGLAWIKVNELEAGVAGLQSPILKFMPEAATGHPCTTPSPPRRAAPRNWRRTRARRSHAPTIWCSTAVSWVAAAFVSISPMYRKVCSRCWVSMRQRRVRSSASCWTPCSTAPRHMAAWRLASIVWLC